MITADLRGKTALVTGGASGIGLATARLFATCGAVVAINDRLESTDLEGAVADLRRAGATIVSAPADVGDPEAGATMVETTVAQLGGQLDFLINNAGVARTNRPIPPAEMDALSEEMWSDILSVNLVAPFRVSRAAAPFLKKSGGAIVNTASYAALGGNGSSLAYAASKAGLVNLTRGLSRALAPEVRVNAVAPGYIRTPWTARFGDAWRDSAVAQNSLKRQGTPEDVAETMLFLCAGAAFINGQTIVIDGGA